MELFSGNETSLGTHGKPVRDLDNPRKWGIKNSAKTLRVAPTLKHWKEHVAGKTPLGIIPIKNDATCMWGSIDIDDYDFDVPGLLRRIEELSLPLVPCWSKSGGVHLFLFLQSPVPAEHLQRALSHMAAVLGYANCEIFPKQSKLNHERGDQGNWIVMPYFGSDYDGVLHMQHGIKKTGASMSLEEFVRVSYRLRISPDQLSEVRLSINGLADAKAEVENRTRKKKKGAEKEDKEPKVPFGDGPPCLQYIVASGKQRQGARNEVLFQMAVYYKRKYPEDWASHVERANHLFLDPPLPSSEVEAIIRSHNKTDYHYSCDKEPFSGFCQQFECLTRKYGVANDAVFPKITHLVKWEYEPAIWTVTLNNSKTLDVSTDELENYARFHKACLEQLTECYQLMSNVKWNAIVSAATRRMRDEDKRKPTDESSGDEFHELLETFLTDKRRGRNEEDLLSGRPFEDDAGIHWFRLTAFKRFLEREGFKTLRRGEIANRLRTFYGGESQMRSIRSRPVQVWRIDPDWEPPPPGKKEDRFRLSKMPSISTPESEESKI